MKTLCFPLLLLAPICSPGEDFELILHEIDRSIREGDGLSLADVDGDGQNNPVLSTGNGGQVYWYEKHGPSEWTRHLIAEGFTEIEGTVATDFDGDGKIEVVFFDQATRKPPGLVVLAKQDGEDPRGSWSTVILDDAANHTQQGLVFDITGDGNPDFFYSYEGRGADDGGFFWMQNLGGDPLDADNWVKHMIDRIDGAWWIDSNSPRDFNGNGNGGDILVSVREGRNRAHSTGQVLIYHRPENPVEGLWEKTVVHDMPGNDVLHVCSGDFTGNGDPRDVAVGVGTHRDRERPGFVGLHTYEYGTWKRTSLSDLHTAAVRGYDITRNGIDEIIAMERTTHQMQLWVLDREVGSYALEANYDFIKGDDYVGLDDIDGDGEIHEFFIGSDPQGLFWFKVTVPE